MKKHRLVHAIFDIGFPIKVVSKSFCRLDALSKL